MRKGVAVSPGVAVGTAYCIHEIFVDPDRKQQLSDGEVSAELARYEAARDKTQTDLKALQKKLAVQVGKETAAIFAVHESILRDGAFTNKIRTWIIDDRMTAPAALQRLLTEYSAFFEKTQDEYLKERLNDVRDVVIRLSAHLSEALAPEQKALSGPLVIVANELLPSQVVQLGGIDVRGIVTQAGGATSHAAIIARSRGVPAVSGVRGILKAVKTGDTIVVDGREGHVLVNPDNEQAAAYRKLEREFVHLRDHLAENRDHPALTADGVKLGLLANINGVADAKAAIAMGASGVGLYRTEYLYLTHPSVPDEDEQFEVYRQVVVAAPGHDVTIRTLDIGGDKTVPYLGHGLQEANPFMGWRSIRLSFEHPELLLTQIRAVLRAGAEVESGGTVRLMVPMITAVEEMQRVRAMIRKACGQLQREGKRFKSVPVGMMVEVPAAAIGIDALLREVDFVSIGSNDLVQYLMAADRDNPKVSHLCQPLAPAVLRVLRYVIQHCRRAKKPVTVCGEMSGQPRAFLLLLGMGLRQFSMSPAFVPSIKELASHVTVEEARALVKSVLNLRTTDEVKEFMADQLTKIAPDLRMLDTA
jgi:phosphotransferase system enzyme I (PtsI)